MRRYFDTVLIYVFLLLLAFSAHNLRADEACNGYNMHAYLRSAHSASSYLKDKKDPDRYAPSKAFDGKIETSWVEGKRDDGIGEKIAFYFRGSPLKIRIMPGFGMKKYFRMNNRVKSATLSFYVVKNVIAHQCGEDFQIDEKEIVSRKTIRFKDSMTMQEFDTGLSGTEHLEISPGGLIGVIEIDSVYRGIKWRDTCIAEIKLIEGKSGLKGIKRQKLSPVVIDSRGGLRISLFGSRSDILRKLKIDGRNLKGKNLEKASRSSGLQLFDYESDEIRMMRIISDRWKLENGITLGSDKIDIDLSFGENDFKHERTIGYCIDRFSIGLEYNAKKKVSRLFLHRDCP